MRRVIGLLVAVLLGTTTGGLVLAGPAAAAPCAKGTGVTVVVGSDVRCAASGGGSAAADFRAVGHVLETYQGFVCRIDGVPSKKAEPCNNYPPANAYWGLFWSNGKTGTWVYSQSGASSLTVPTGGWVGFMFQNGSGKTAPPMKPLAAAPAKPKPKPTTPKGSGGSTTSATPSATPSATAATPKPSKSDKSPSPSASPTEGATATTQPGDDLKSTSQESGGSSSLGWIAAALAVVLIAGMGAVLWRRRTAGGRTP